ncbi:MAG: Fic family protein [Acidobacteria bacterium]|nr:Fic family protein [Acidobacteriota bacterium]
MSYLSSSGSNLPIHPLIAQPGGSSGLRNRGTLESGWRSGRLVLAARNLSDLESKAAALGHSPIQNHPFLNGNKRVGHATMKGLLCLRPRN